MGWNHVHVSSLCQCSLSCMLSIYTAEPLRFGNVLSFASFDLGDFVEYLTIALATQESVLCSKFCHLYARNS